MLATQDGWSWPRKLVIHVAANQIGKTLGVAVAILWACIYKIGFNPADGREWFNRPYVWFHVAPTQQQANHPLNDMRMLIKGAHPAQKLPFRLPQGLVMDAKVAQYYDGFAFANGAEAQFRTTDDKAAALQGYRAAGISFDEAAFEDHLRSVVNETLMMRLISTGGPLLLVSTPNGMNDYFDIVEEVRAGAREPEERVWVKDDSAVVWSVITDNVGFGITQQMVDHMEANLDPVTKEQQLRGAFLEPAEAFFTPTDRVLAAFRDMPAQVAPEPGHKYIIFWDPSVSSDPTAVVVLDVTKKPWTGVYFRHYKRPMGVTELIGEIFKLHGYYNGAKDPKRVRRDSVALTGFDATSMGGVIIKQLLVSLRPQRPLNFGGPDKKIKALTNLRAALTRTDPRELLLPNGWTELRQEVLNYKLKDDKLRQDSVMALTGGVHTAAHGFSGEATASFNVGARISSPRMAWG